jgi:L-amino acid N-acyltransferase
MTIRPATAADLPAVNDIYNHYVLTSTCTYQVEPTPFEDRVKWFTGRSAKHPVIVAEEGGTVVGWGALSPYNLRCGYAGAVENSVYIHKDHHRKGLGRALLVELIRLGKAAGLHTIIGGISMEQAASIALHEKLGFKNVAHLKEMGVKFGRRLDVGYWQLMLGE